VPYKLPFVEQSLWQDSFMFSRENIYQDCRLFPAVTALYIGEAAEIHTSTRGDTALSRLVDKEPTLILPVTRLRSFRSRS